MKYSKIFFNLTISIIFFLATHIAEAYHIQPTTRWGFEVQIHEYKISKEMYGEKDVCYEMSGSEATWYLDEVDCNKFSGVSPCK
ncbi:unnamed protein product [Rhizophagus irregularis]|nr:unnamed protein product [Rhizophagus irregularis]